MYMHMNPGIETTVLVPLSIIVGPVVPGKNHRALGKWEAEKAIRLGGRVSEFLTGKSKMWLKGGQAPVGSGYRQTNVLDNSVSVDLSSENTPFDITSAYNQIHFNKFRSHIIAQCDIFKNKVSKPSGVVPKGPRSLNRLFGKRSAVEGNQLRFEKHMGLGATNWISGTYLVHRYILFRYVEVL